MSTTEFPRTEVGGVSLPRLIIGTTTPDEAREVIDISTAPLEHRVPGVDLQSTRSKNSLKRSGT